LETKDELLRSKFKGQDHNTMKYGQKSLVQKCTFPMKMYQMTVHHQRPSSFRDLAEDFINYSNR